jgi:hypothetical protein
VLGANRIKAIDTLTEIVNVYSELFGSSVILSKTTIDEYVIELFDSLSDSTKILIQPILDKNNLIIENINQHTLIRSN